MLDLPHICRLTAFVKELRIKQPQTPFFDPMDGGTDALYLFLFEKPGRRAAENTGSGFISRDNDDLTAKATFCFMKQAGIERKAAVIWNVVPAWNGTRKVKSEELKAGLRSLSGLMKLLPALQAIVLVGTNAQKAQSDLDHSRYRIFCSLHPSPINKGTRRKEWEEIWKSWARVKDLTCPSDC
jgi:uracil-DNA glycosylase